MNCVMEVKRDGVYRGKERLRGTKYMGVRLLMSGEILFTHTTALKTRTLSVMMVLKAHRIK